MIDALLETYLVRLKNQGLHRQHVLANSSVLNFSSNDYLGLSNNSRIRAAYIDGFKKFPVGSGSSALINGYQSIHRALEESFANALGCDAALLFSSGFAANQGITALLQEIKLPVLIDKSVHASVYNGLHASKSLYTRFHHNDATHLEQKLTSLQLPQAVVTEGIFSMSGAFSDLRRFSTICNQHNSALLVDEAHSFGVVGKKGMGAVSHFNLSQSDVALRLITFGKAMGAFGAVVVGCKNWIDALVQASRTYIYTTALSPAIAYGLLHSLPIVQQADHERQHLSRLISYFVQKRGCSNLVWSPSSTAIQQLRLGNPHHAIAFSQALLVKNIRCHAIREPTVPRSQTGLRIVLNSTHSLSDIDGLFAALAKINAT